MLENKSARNHMSFVWTRLSSHHPAHAVLSRHDELISYLQNSCSSTISPDLPQTSILCVRDEKDLAHPKLAPPVSLLR